MINWVERWAPIWWQACRSYIELSYSLVAHVNCRPSRHQQSSDYIQEKSLYHLASPSVHICYKSYSIVWPVRTPPGLTNKASLNCGLSFYMCAKPLGPSSQIEKTQIGNVELLSVVVNGRVIIIVTVIITRETSWVSHWYNWLPADKYNNIWGEN